MLMQQLSSSYPPTLLPPPPQLPLTKAVFIPQVEMMMMAGHVAEMDLKRFSHLLAYASPFDLFFSLRYIAGGRSIFQASWRMKNFDA